MTLPDQRTRAVLNARQFLLRLASPYAENGIKGIRSEVRQEARHILRHFPILYDVTDPKAFDENAVNEWYTRYYEEKQRPPLPAAGSRDVRTDGRRKRNRC
jgi:hypothetical protein